ncbi:MAG: lipoyl(octanoyl) transferase LipB [Bryobacteraceae bacterium]
MHSAAQRVCEVRDLGRVPYRESVRLQKDLVERRKANAIPDQLLFVEHPHVITLGRNAREANILATPAVLSRAGVDVVETDRGGDVTYHGPGQIVGYPILDLKAWKRDVGAYLRAIEQVLIDALADFGIAAGREQGMTGVWVQGRKVAAIGVHLSRWVTSHGFALNVDTDLDYFRYIVPCGLTRPVGAIREFGCEAGYGNIQAAIVARFAEVFDFNIVKPQTLRERIA